MTVHHHDSSVTVHHGDCLDVLAELPDSSVDAVVTDPPYGLEFMGKDWDAPWRGQGVVDAVEWNQGESNPYSRARIRSGRSDSYGTDGATTGRAFQQWCEQWAAECLRVLKPGGHMLAFGGTRTWHRLACAVEDAGFEVRDSIAWLYSQGFPKSLNVGKAAGDAACTCPEAEHGVRTVLDSQPVGQPAGEPGPLADERGSQARRGRPLCARCGKPSLAGWGTALKPSFEPIVVARKPLAGTVAGNVLTYGTGALNIDACRVASDETLGRFNNARTDGSSYIVQREAGLVDNSRGLGRWPANVLLDGSQADALDAQAGPLVSGAKPQGGETRTDRREWRFPGGVGYGDTGGASRFFPTFRYEAKAPTAERPRDERVAHPTVKPLDLMRWLVRLVTPPGGVVLDPFAGSGTTAEACIVEGMRCITIEREAAYLPLIVARLTKPIEPVLFG